MQIAERETGTVTVLDLSGKITLGEGDTQLKDKLNSLLHQGKKNVLFNLAEVNYVDSAGLGALVMAYTTVTREGGALKLLNVTRKLQDLLSITKLLTVFETFDSEDEALRSYTK
jgi:anti-sigma B factor antagonist